MAELTEFAPKLSEAQRVLFSETVLSKQYSARFLNIASQDFFFQSWGLLGQRDPSPPEFAQPGLSRSNGSYPQREGINLGVFVAALTWGVRLQI